MPSVMTSNASNDPHDYHDLLQTTLSSTTYILTYSIPLIIVSLLLTFAGAFLTLDRTRTFTPRQPPSLAPKARFCRVSAMSLLEGGVGGIAIGFAFGAHFTTFLSLLIPASSGSTPLGSKAFLAVCMLSAVVCSLIAGRWRYAALTFVGCTGFAAFSLALSVILHPTLLTRIILTSILVVLGTVLCLLPWPRYHHVPVRFAASAAGSLGLVTCVALFAHIPSWSNAWARFWVSNDIEWGTAQEKGLSATYCILLVLGVGCDWLLHRYFGENPDEKWDHYLSDYNSSLPNDEHRAGQFEPPRSFWDRFFARNRPSHFPLQHIGLQPDMLDAKQPPSSLLYPERKVWAHTDLGSVVDVTRPSPPPGLLRQPRRKLFGFTSQRRMSQRRVEFSPLPSDTVTLVNAEPPLNSFGTRGNNDEQRNPSSAVQPAEDERWMQFWQDVKVKAENY
ncbi:hypothetical protein EIP91_006906 [Steccherinum ochraceum]|uniref:DUF4203 domain-containing protein n=1 Tax=Steccherinum ochraceum TaxID=92696 RepID=A0A4R0RJE8_9APHY|nr:hypothetical protein EIP91_006906 [Steccherinum ochraceum]